MCWFTLRVVNAHRTIVPIAASTLGDIADRGVPVPTYDRAALKPKIVHVGVGGFHRAHLALYTDELATGGSNWGIRGLGLLPGDQRMADALGAQDHMYSLTEKGTGVTSTRVIGSIIDFVVAAGDDSAAIAAIADEDVAIVSLTITESGYSEPGVGERNTFDLLAEALEQRRTGGLGPVTILSCDNLPGNGDVAKSAMLAAAQRHSAALHLWVETSCSFPNSMVDRITPVTSDNDRTWLAETLGIEDRWPVVAEPFRQWVIEDNFVAGRPAWEDVGALFTDNVHAWELYKLRMLNAGHSCIAYLCALAEITFVDEAMALPMVHSYLSDLLHLEALPTLHEIAGHPREEYIRIVLERFANTGVRDQIARLCIDGTAKYPTFLIPTIVRQLELDGPIERSTLALAGWARYLGTIDPGKQAFDAAGFRPRQMARQALNDPLAFLDFDAVFPPALRDNERFRKTFALMAQRLDEMGPLRAMMS